MTLEQGIEEFLASLRAERGLSPATVDAYRRAAGIEQRSIEARTGMTLPLMALRQWKKLAHACDEILKLDPDHAEAGEARRFLDSLKGGG